MSRWIRSVVTGAWCALFAACGGGGGTETPSATDGTASGAPSPVEIQPARLDANIEPGTASTITFRATLKSTARFDTGPFVQVQDSKGVLTGRTEFGRVSDTSVSVTVYARGTLDRGQYNGTLAVLVCRDQACASPYPGFPVQLPYSLMVAPNALDAQPLSSMTATYYGGGVPPVPVNVLVRGSNQSWEARSASSWLQVDRGSGRGTEAFTVRHVLGALPEGMREGSVIVRAADGQERMLTFRVNVLPKSAELPGGGGEMFAFAGINGSVFPSKAFAFDPGSPNAAWTVTSSAPWLTVSPESGVGPAVVSLRPDPRRGALASGGHMATVTIGGTGLSARTLRAQLRLTAPTLSASPSVVTLGGAKGRDAGARTTLIGDDTGQTLSPFTVSGVPSWLSVSSSGAVLSLTPNPAVAVVGSTTAVVQLTRVVNGDTVTLPITVNLNVDQRRVLSSEWSIALASAPGRATLTRTLSITDSFTGAAPEGLSARSDIPWLSATVGSGAAGSATLTMMADPPTMPPGALFAGTITVSSTAPGAQPATIRVMLDTSTLGLASTVSTQRGYTELVADPILPYVYAHAGGGSIDIWDTRTGQLRTTIPRVGTALGRMGVSPSGHRLYVLDTAVNNLRVVSLTDYSVASWATSKTAWASTSVMAIRPNGVEVVLVGNGTAYSEGRSLGDTPIQGVMTATPDGRRVFTTNQGISPSTLDAYDVDYSEMAGGALSVFRRSSGTGINGSENGRDIAFDPVTQRLFTASAAPYQCAIVDPDTLVSRGLIAPETYAYGAAVEVTRDGRVICGYRRSFANRDVVVFASDGTRLAHYALPDGDLLAGQLVVAADGTTLVVLSEVGEIVFIPIGR
jgi:hypothetical protein